jgi:hypothetical protein
MQFIAIGSELKMMTERAQEVLSAVAPERVEQGLVRY